MIAFTVTYEDGKVDYVGSRSMLQAIRNAAALRPGVSFRVRESTDAERDALVRAHSLPLDAGDQ